jgi:hypothetical protein
VTGHGFKESEMHEVTFPISWRPYEPNNPFAEWNPGRWGLQLSRGMPASLLAHDLRMQHYDLWHIDYTLKVLRDLRSGVMSPGGFSADDFCEIWYGNDYCVLEPIDDDEVDSLLLTADQYEKAFIWLRDLCTHPGFKDPNAVFEPLTVQIIEESKDAWDHYLRLGGSSEASEKQ